MSLPADFAAPLAHAGLSDAELQQMIARGRRLHAHATGAYLAEIGTLLAALFQPSRPTAPAPRPQPHSAL